MLDVRKEPKMFEVDRHREILELLRTEKSISVHKLAAKLYVSESTVRRDLNRLASAGMLQRSFGGAVLVEDINSEVPLIVRDEKNSAEKKTIARLAASLIEENDIIFVDPSSTAYALLPYLDERVKAVVTNSPKVSLALASNPSLNIYLTGGYLRKNALSLVGHHAEEMLANFNCTKMFFSCTSISKSQLSDLNEEEANLKRKMLRQSKTIVAMLDHTKFGLTAFSHVCNLTSIDYVVTDMFPGDEWIRIFEENNIKLLCAPPFNKE